MPIEAHSHKQDSILETALPDSNDLKRKWKSEHEKCNLVTIFICQTALSSGPKTIHYFCGGRESQRFLFLPSILPLGNCFWRLSHLDFFHIYHYEHQGTRCPTHSNSSAHGNCTRCYVTFVPCILQMMMNCAFFHFLNFFFSCCALSPNSGQFFLAVRLLLL